MPSRTNKKALQNISLIPESFAGSPLGGDLESGCLSSRGCFVIICVACSHHYHLTSKPSHPRPEWERQGQWQDAEMNNKMKNNNILGKKRHALDDGEALPCMCHRRLSCHNKT